ncbi:hypothetical protein VNO80_14750 [Phaseolus coccineus]|uniref:Uncharacterized protein n=1 Tax=Phaseolus coccineus TaxID=3886 RepID=A0AAN9MMD2_PHACN
MFHLRRHLYISVGYYFPSCFFLCSFVSNSAGFLCVLWLAGSVRTWERVKKLPAKVKRPTGLGRQTASTIHRHTLFL